jgi:hypothetical protein
VVEGDERNYDSEQGAPYVEVEAGGKHGVGVEVD